MIAFADACARLEAVLQGAARRQIVAGVSTSGDFRSALLRLRDRMRSHSWKSGETLTPLARFVQTYDARTRQDGFHVLHDWDGIADAVNEDIIPVDVVNYLIDKRGAEPCDTAALAILLDYYFLHLLTLLSLRVWDDGDADDNLDRVHQLLLDLQGAGGSGQQFADNAETLILLGTSHFEPEERGYGTLLESVRTLNPRHRANIATGHAASMASHLRFGFEATYARDPAAMRADNVADYPWLAFALATTMNEYARMHEDNVHGISRERIVEAILNGLSPDARAFVGDPPASLGTSVADRVRFRELFHRYRKDLLEECERHRPSDEAYSPLSFFFNFSHNVLKGTVIDALLRGEPWTLTFNDLLTGVSGDGPKGQSKIALARMLMGYARASPDRIRGRLMPVIVYDAWAGRLASAETMRALRE